MSNRFSSTRAAFFIIGLISASFAIMIPFAKIRLGLDNTDIGLFILLMGIGAIIIMSFVGSLNVRYGCRKMFRISAGILIITTAVLALTNSLVIFGVCIFIFGAANAMGDVSMNIHALSVEQEKGEAIMSGFHALYSGGGLVGSGVMTVLLSFGLSSFGAISFALITIFVLLVSQIKGMSNIKQEDKKVGFVIPRGIVILVGILCFVAFIMEGAVSDWSGILLFDQGIKESLLATGYLAFSIAMTIMRFSGDKLINIFGRKYVFLIGASLGVAGFIIISAVSNFYILISGFALIGVGMSNIVPILFSSSANQNIMPPALAISSVSAIGYLGILIGPAGIGSIADALSISAAFLILGCTGVCLLVGYFFTKKMLK